MFCSSRWSKLPHEARQLSKMAKSPEGHHSNSAGSMSPDCSASRGLGGVLKERSRKLLIPLAFGMAVLGPFLRWREMEHGLSRDIHGNYLPARRVPYKHVLAAYYRDPELVTWSHLWFLAYLWTFSILYAPVWAFVSPGVNRRIADKPSRAKIVLFLSLCAVTASEVMLRPRWPGFQNLVDDWANFASYSAYLVLGLLIGSLPTLKHIVRQHATALLVAGLATSTWFAGFCFQVGIYVSIFPPAHVFPCLIASHESMVLLLMCMLVSALPVFNRSWIAPRCSMSMSLSTHRAARLLLPPTFEKPVVARLSHLAACYHAG